MLEADGISARVVSMPCLELFEEQPEEYRNAVLPARDDEKRGSGRGRKQHALGQIRRVFDGCYITMDTFGASAPAAQLYSKSMDLPRRMCGKIVKAYVNSYGRLMV